MEEEDVRIKVCRSKIRNYKAKLKETTNIKFKKKIKQAIARNEKRIKELSDLMNSSQKTKQKKESKPRQKQKTLF